MSHNRASVTAILGATGSGKSLYLKRRIARERPRRLIVWDPMQEYGDHGDVHDRLGELLKAAAGKSFTLVFQPAAAEDLRAKQFDAVCELALAARNLTFVAEELRFVTRPSWAPLNWARVTMTGRHSGLTVIGTSQRPASIDKDFLGNCSTIHTGRLVYPEDVRTVARVMRVAESEILSLPPLAWIEKDMQSGKQSAGVIALGKPPAAAQKRRSL